jgi:hypothetical protein
MLGVVSGRAAAILRSTETYPMLADLCKQIGILKLIKHFIETFSSL